MELNLKIKSALLFTLVLQVNIFFASITSKELPHQPLIRIFSLNGSNDHQFSFSNLAAGIYFIVGQQNGQTLKQKIIVAK